MMTSINFVFSAFLLILALSLNGFGQQAALTTNPAGKPFFQSVVLNTEQKKGMDFSVRLVGSVTGRVFSDAESASAGGIQQGIGGVRVSLRSRDAGFERFVIEQFTDATGVYSFRDIRPGQYTVEIDPTDLPTTYRNIERPKAVEVEPLQNADADISITSQRVISGIVFVDVDRDGKFKRGKDIPVGGAVITVGGSLAVSDATGFYVLRDLPAGRIGLRVSWPRKSDSTHVVLDLSDGAVTNRTVNIPTTN